MNNHQLIKELFFGDSVQTGALLNTQTWANNIPLSELHLLFCEILNNCVTQSGTELSGYLITDSKIYLIIHGSKGRMNDFLSLFYWLTVRRLFRWSSQNNQLKKFRAFRNEYNSPADLFNVLPLYEMDLVKLLIGVPVYSKFIDTELNQMKSFLSHYNYCSYQNYKGAKGPVIVKV